MKTAGKTFEQLVTDLGSSYGKSDEKWYSAAETAALLRKRLKDEFPTTKFSIQSSTYSGGASIRVEWRQGPTKAAVEAVSGEFTAGTFNGMIDLFEYQKTQLLGTRCHFAAHYIFCERKAA